MTDAGTTRRIGVRVLGISPVARAVRAIARLRGHQLALVYHRVAHLDRERSEIVPTVSPEVLRRHVGALAEVAAVVDLGAIGPASAHTLHARAARPRTEVAMTFDDDS